MSRSIVSNGEENFYRHVGSEIARVMQVLDYARITAMVRKSIWSDMAFNAIQLCNSCLMSGVC